DRARQREQGRGGQRLRNGFGYAKVDYARHRVAVHFTHQNVGWLQIAMDDGFLVRMLYALADLNEQLQALAQSHPVLVAVRCDGNTGYVFHREVWPALRCGSRVEYFGDAGVI